MSHPVPGHDYSDKHNQETHKEYMDRRKKGEMKSKVGKKALNQALERRKSGSIRELKTDEE